MWTAGPILSPERQLHPKVLPAWKRCWSVSSRPHFVAGIIMRDGRCIQAAPILKWCRGACRADPIGRVPTQGVGWPRCFVDSRPGPRPAGTRRKGGPGVRRPERIPLNRKGLTLACPTLRRPPVYRRRRERKPRTVCSRDCNERRSGPPGDPGAPLHRLPADRRPVPPE